MSQCAATSAAASAPQILSDLSNEAARFTLSRSRNRTGNALMAPVAHDFFDSRPAAPSQSHCDRWAAATSSAPNSVDDAVCPISSEFTVASPQLKRSCRSGTGILPVLRALRHPRRVSCTPFRAEQTSRILSRKRVVPGTANERAAASSNNRITCRVPPPPPHPARASRSDETTSRPHTPLPSFNA